MRSKRDGKRVYLCTKSEEYEEVQKPEGGRAKMARDANVTLPDDSQACDADQDPPTIAQNYLECKSV